MATKPLALKGLEKASMEAYLKPLSSLQATAHAFELAEKHVTGWLGVPICKPNCGKCCEVTSVTVWDVEARFICSWLMGLPQERRDAFLDICESWLLERDPRLTSYGIEGVLTMEQWRKLKPEVDSLVYHSPCPMLTAEKQCLVHDARPLVCHAYGVTRMPGLICPRPLSPRETEGCRAHIGSESPLGKVLRGMVVKVIQQASEMGWKHSRFLPTAVYQILRPEKFRAYVFDGRIASARLAATTNNMALLFQHQLEDAWAQEGYARPLVIPVSSLPTR